MLTVFGVFCIRIKFVLHWDQICFALESNLFCIAIGIKFVLHNQICFALRTNLFCIGIKFVLHWDQICFALESNLFCIGIKFVLHWEYICLALRIQNPFKTLALMLNELPYFTTNFLSSWICITMRCKLIDFCD